MRLTTFFGIAAFAFVFIGLANLEIKYLHHEQHAQIRGLRG
jgi:hypothetical protein